MVLGTTRVSLTVNQGVVGSIFKKNGNNPAEDDKVFRSK